MGLVFDVSGTEEVKRFLTNAARSVRNPRPVLIASGEELMVRNQRRLRAGVDVHGKPIPKSRRSSMFGGQTLVERGAYLASWTYSTPDKKTLDYSTSDKRARVLRGDIEEVHAKPGHFLWLPLRAAGGMFAGPGVDVRANRSGRASSHYDRKSTFVRAIGRRLFVMQKTTGGALRALAMLVKSVKTKRREVPGIGPSDLEMIATNLGNQITGEKR